MVTHSSHTVGRHRAALRAAGREHRGSVEILILSVSSTLFSLLLSQLRSEGVEPNRAVTGSVTGRGFYKNKPPEDKRKLSCVQTEYLIAGRRGRQDDSQPGLFLGDYFCRLWRKPKVQKDSGTQNQ